MEPREAALRCLLDVLSEGATLAQALPRRLQGPGDARDHALAQDLAYGVLRWLPRLQAVLGQLLERPVRERDRDVELVLLMGLYQLDHTRAPDYAVVDECVGLAGRLRKSWARGLVNGVLRAYTRRRGSVQRRLADDPEFRHAHPRWLLEALRAAWPGDWAQVAAANNAHPPMTLRVNRARGSREAYLARLAAAGIGAAPGRHGPDAVVLEAPMDVGELPGFGAGDVSVQDEAAQLAAPLLDPPPGAAVLDACAAPGGKAGHLAELGRAGRLVALDRSPSRLARLEEGLHRLGVAAAVVQGDAADPGPWWDGRPFDRILLDAPCSATGVIRRNPDVKALRTPAQVEELAAQQLRLLRALWPLLAPSGLLVYATCSVLPAENDRAVKQFLASEPAAGVLRPKLSWGRATGAGRQILPGEDGMDGFYYACLRKGPGKTP
jgi:16S rRNA (cytosine967-C5)-methyltransferase